MSVQSKPQMVEAVLFFNERGICKEMFYPEFEAMLDGVVNFAEFADRQMRAAYVLINPRLLIRSLVLFYLDFDEQGRADTGWNIPLRHLAEKAGRGPDLGAGPIRLACRSQCPVSWHQMHLWDPSLAPTQNDLVLLRDAVKRNNLGVLVEEDSAPVELGRLQVASEDRWYAKPDAEREEAARLAEQLEQEHRQKTAQLIKQQRLRITSLIAQHEEELAKARLAAEQQLAPLQEQLLQFQQQLKQQQALNQNLKQQIQAQSDSFAQARQEMQEQLRSIEHSGQTENDSLRSQYEAELQAKVRAAVVEYKEQIAIRDMELAYRHEQDAQAQADIQRLRQQCEHLASQGGEQILERLSRLGVVFVAYHPGAGHLTIPLQDMARYQDNPVGYAASKCFVAEGQYRKWLAHYQEPTCEASLANGERCAMPLDRVDTPSRFVDGDSNCCSRHKVASRVKSQA